MIERYVLDGAPGSGKTTLLFGTSDGAEIDGALHTMVRLGHRCFHESVARAHAVLERQGTCYAENPALWLATIAGLDRDQHAQAGEGLNFYDRSFHHWKFLAELQGIDLPEWYEAENARLRYGSPVFLVAPIQSIDLSGAEYRISRRFTWAQRMDMYEQLHGLYSGLGYEVAEVPVFEEGDPETNNLRRIDFILDRVR